MSAPRTAPHAGTPLGSEYKDAKRDRRRTEILDAAAFVFARDGYDAATMQDIADRLGMRSASLYYYVQSKAAALEEVCRRGGREFVDRLRQEMESDRSVPDIIETGISLHLQARWQDYVATFTFNRQHLSGAIREEMDGIARDYSELWARLIARGKKEGVVAAGLDARFTANAILSVCNDAARAAAGTQGSDRAVAKKALSLLLDGIRRR